MAFAFVSVIFSLCSVIDFDQVDGELDNRILSMTEQILAIHRPEQHCQPEQDSGKDWGNYISLLTHSVIENLNRLEKSSLTNTMSILTIRHYHHSKCESYDYLSVDFNLNNSLTVPCAYLHLETWLQSEHRILISVYRSFMVNMTILKAYVPLSDWCTPHNIEVHEGHHMSQHFLIERLCGQISMESIYSSCNRIILIVQFKPYRLHHSVNLHAVYQIHTQGVAYSFSNLQHKLIIPHWWKVNISPAFLLHIKQKVQYFWYISNSIYTPLVYDRHIAKSPIIAYMKIRIAVLMCQMTESNIAIYRGHVSKYWTQWMMQPHSTYLCNITEPSYLVVDFHMYATVVVTLSHIETDMMTVHLTFQHDVEALANVSEMRVATKQRHSDAVLQRQHGLQHGHLSSNFTAFIFDDYKYFGHKTTVNNILEKTAFHIFGYSRVNITDGK